MAGLMSGGASGIGGLFFGNPGYNSSVIDQGTQDLINDQAKQASTSSDEYADRDLRGTSGSADNTASNNFHTALGGPEDSNMKAALEARSQRAMDMSLNQLQRQAKVAGVGQKSAQMKNAFGYVTAQQQAMNQANEAQRQAQLNNEATRSSIISGLFGAAGTIGGLMGGGAGGGSGGSAVSSPQMGSQFGQAPSAPNLGVNYDMWS
jgi:hypothetical protein